IGLILVALAFPLLELAVLIKVGQSIGFWSTVLLLAAMGVFGGWLVQRQGLAAAQRAMETIGQGEAPIAPVIDSVLIMLAGVLLLLPGLITDVAGLLLLIPPVRRAFARWAVSRMLARGDIHVRRTEWRTDGQDRSSADPDLGRGPRRSGSDVVIDGEWQRVDETDPGR
ncbi:unnamed protein product, partial [Phaeothamnion confervicola]